MDLRTQSIGMAFYRAVTHIGKHDAAYVAANEEYIDAIDALPHRHVSEEPTPEQLKRLKEAYRKCSQERERIRKLFEDELEKSGYAETPENFGKLVDEILERMGNGS